MGEGSGGVDPFDGWQLDDDFVRNAAHREPTAAERVAEGRRAEVERRARRNRDAGRRQVRRSRRRRALVWAVGLVAAARVVLLFTAGPGAGGDTGGAGTGLLSAAGVDDVFLVDGRIAEYPTPDADAAEAPLGVPPVVDDDAGPYAFIARQGDGDPVAYDPCEDIEVVVNRRTMPPGADRLLAEALDEVSAATGLVFTLEGSTDEVPVDERPPVQPDRYGDRWAPVLVAWSDPVETPGLAGAVAGMGGSQSVSARSGEAVFVTGVVFLDGPQLASFPETGRGLDAARSVIVHELGHLVGLDHVDDASQLMNPEGSEDVTTFGAGDRAGLAALGRGACHPDR